MYKHVITLNNHQLKAKKSQLSSLVEWAFVKAANQSLKDGKNYFIEVTPIKVEITNIEPISGNWYKVEGAEVSKFIPTFAI